MGTSFREQKGWQDPAVCFQCVRGKIEALILQGLAGQRCTELDAHRGTGGSHKEAQGSRERAGSRALKCGLHLSHGRKLAYLPALSHLIGKHVCSRLDLDPFLNYMLVGEQSPHGLHDSSQSCSPLYSGVSWGELASAAGRCDSQTFPQTSNAVWNLNPLQSQEDREPVIMPSLLMRPSATALCHFQGLVLVRYASQNGG